MVKSTVDWLKGYMNTLVTLFDVSDRQELQVQKSIESRLTTESSRVQTLQEPQEDAFADYSHQRYFQHLIDCHRVINVVGTEDKLILPLEEIFVPLCLSLAPHLPADALHLSELIPLAKVRRGLQDVWEYLTLDQISCLTILGVPGSGKTSLLKQMTLTLSHPQKRLFSSAPNKLPILLSLANHHSIINAKPDYTLAEAAHHALMIAQMADPLPPSWFEQQLQTGQCLIMLDGLDEIADSTDRQPVVMWIEQQIERYTPNRFVITSRLLAYSDNPLKNTMVLEVQPFNREQVQHLVKGWYQANQIAHSEEKVEEFIQLCLQPQYSPLTKNPLLLTMMTTLHHDGISSPNRRVELYQQICDLVLHSSNNKQKFDLTSAQTLRVLQPLAYYMMRHKFKEIALDEASKIIYVPLDMVSRNPKGVDFLQMVARASGLLTEGKNGQYSFVHLTFQEYLAATHILEQRLQHKLINNVEDSWWHETSRLYGAAGDATSIVAATLKKLDPPIPALLLAVRCVEEANHIQPEIYNKVENILQQQVESTDATRRRIVADALLSLRLNRMMPVDQNLYVADSLITNAEYQLFVDEQRVKHVQPEDWWQLQYTFRAGAGKEPAIDLRPSDAVAFCQWLTERDNQARVYRLPYTGEFNPLVSEVGYWTQGEMEQEYKLENEQTVVLSIDTLESRLHRVLYIDLTYHPENALVRIRDLDRDLEYILDHENQGERAVAVALALVRDFTHDRAHNRAVNISNEALQAEKYNEPVESGWYANFLAWLITQKLLTVLRHQQKPHSWLDIFDRNQSIIAIKQKDLQTLAERYFELYVDLASLEKRIHGQFLTSRGIRIVASRQDLQQDQPKSALSESHSSSAAPSSVDPVSAVKAETAAVTASTPVVHKKRKVIQKKICLLGDEGVGKTSLVRRCVEGRFDEKYLSTVGVTISRKTLVRPTYTMNLLIWDMEGAPGFKKAQLNYLRGATGALIVCDLTRRETLAAFERYARQLRALNGSVPFVFVGNKVDLKSRTISSSELEALSKTLGGSYLLTSAKTDTEVTELFELMADLIEEQTP